jgi:two-component system CheB/CheR fusion protein
MKSASEQEKNADDASSQAFPVVGVGASAGGLAAFKEFLGTIPQDSNMAYVLVQHMSPKHESILPELLSQGCAIPVMFVTDDLKLEPNRVYVLPPNRMLTTVDGKLSLEPITNRRVKLIDRFFSSLGVVHQSFAVGVILSGTMEDGTLGLQVIKSSGGITFAQEVDSAAHAGMPQNAINSGSVDFILPADQIVPKLLQINQPFHLRYTESEINAHTPEADEEVFKQLLTVLRIRRGVDFSNYKQSTIKRRIIRRMALNKIDKPDEYLRFLRDNKSEQDLLYNDMLISVTSFFRDTKSFELVCTTILPSILSRKTAFDPLRIWVAGCASGEEAYTLAICIHEHLGDSAYSRKIQIFATDISETAIAKARSGIYRLSELAGLSSQQILQFFNKVDGHYQVNKALRDMCVFAHHNLLKDPPFSNLDLVSCRNVLIYLDPVLQKRALSTFHYGLNEYGYLMLGKSESVGNTGDLFSASFPHEKIYQTKGPKGRYRNITSTTTERALKDFDQETELGTRAKDIHSLADNILLSKFTPSGVLVNHSFDVLEFRGKTDQWLVVAPGKPSFNVLKLAREGLAFELRNLLHLAKTSQAPARKELVFFKINDQPSYADIDVIPITETEEIHYLILFQQSIQPVALKHSTEPLEMDYADIKTLIERNAQLEKELSQTREDMRAITEVQEAANEELQSANEELLSGNEELQSLNEELESSKEELQSTNEEITIVNNELLDRNEQLNNARKYNEEIFNTIHDPLLILDSELKVLRATDGFYRLFRLHEEEVEGKFIYELGDRQWRIPALKTQLMSVLPKQGFVKDFEIDYNFSIGRRILKLSARQFTPHNQEKVIILAIHDITDKRKVEEGLLDAERMLAESQERLHFAMESAGVGSWDFDPLSGDLIWDHKCKLLHGFTAVEHVDYSRYLTQILAEDRDMVAFATHKSLIGSQNGNFNVEYRLVDLGDGKERWIKSKGKAYFNKEKIATRFIGTVLDITAEKRVESQTRELVRKKDEFIAIASHELKTPLTSIKGIIQILERSASNGQVEKVKELTSKASAQVDRFGGLVDQLLDGTNIQAGELRLQKTYFSLLGLVQTCMAHATDYRERVQIEVSGSSEIMVYADRDRIEQVMRNLINNAVKYSPDSDRVQVKVFERDGFASVHVTDFGIGVEKRKVPLIFDRFYRVDEHNVNYPGLGLGLFIAAEIIRRHKGEIGVESESGKGSTFWFSIPVKEDTDD